MPARVLVIALDAYEKDLLLQWARSGELETLGDLLQRGIWGVIEGPPGIYAGAMWPSFNTGLSPAHHRRFFRRQARRGEYLDVDFKPTDIQGQPFWDVLGAAGRRVAVLDVPHTRLSPDLNGIQVIDWASHEPELEQALTHPTSLRDEIISRFGVEPPDLCEGSEHTVEGCRALHSHLQRRLHSKVEMSRYYLRSADWDFFITAFGEAHCAGHQWWHLHDIDNPRHDPAVAATCGNLLKQLYVDLDRAVGELIAEAGPDTRLVVFSGHGMGPVYNESVVLDEILRRLESSAKPAAGSVFAGLKKAWYTLPPSIRSAAPLRLLKKRMQGSLHRSLLVPDRQTRRFFAVPNNPHAGAVRINVAGREAHGMVQPGEEYRLVCDSLRQELSALRCADTGEPAVTEVFVASEIYDGPYADEIPDLLVQWSRRRPLRALSSPRIGTVPIPPISGRSGDHTRAGLFVATGPGLTPGRVDEPVAIENFAPTFAAMLDVTPSPAFAGKPISALLAGQ